MKKLLNRVLCFLGLHDFQVMESTFGFGAGGSVSKVKCRRCGYITTRTE